MESIKPKPRVPSLIADLFILAAGAIILAALLVVFIGSMLYWNVTFAATTSTLAKLFWIGILSAIAAGFMYFSEYAINMINTSFRSIRSNGRR